MDFFMKIDEDVYVNTGNGKLYDDREYQRMLYNSRREHNNSKKYHCTVYESTIDCTVVFTYKVEAVDDGICLSVIRNSFNIDTLGVDKEIVYTCSLNKNCEFFENGAMTFDEWHEYFASLMRTKRSLELNVEKCAVYPSMPVINKVFPFAIQENPFLFIQKMRGNKKYKKILEKYSDTSYFDALPYPHLNRNIGKRYDRESAYYAWQTEFMYNNNVYWDIVVLHGPVDDGVITIEEKHRFFVSEDFCYSPTGSDARILVNMELIGEPHILKMKKRYPMMMLDKYNGKYPYIYALSKWYISGFELVAKAGYGDWADMMLEDYFSDTYDRFEYPYYNIYGKNDKEIFGFRFNRLRNFVPNFLKNSYEIQYSVHQFSFLVRCIKGLIEKCPYFFDTPNITYSMYNFVSNNVVNGDKWALNPRMLNYIRWMGKEDTTMYRDYLRMCYQNNLFPDGMYPKNLKHSHDTLVAYMNQKQEVERNEKFVDVVKEDDYVKNCYNNASDKFCILAPRTANDLVHESYVLNHCVRTYIGSVASGQSKIYFMRNREHKSNPFITIEVVRNRVVQARGKGNRSLDGEEKAYLKKWCNEKQLENVA